MPIVFTCGSCAGKFKVDEKMAGKKVRCPKCKTIGQIPSPPAAADLSPIAEPEIDYQVKPNADDDIWSQPTGATSPDGANPFASPTTPSSGARPQKMQSSATPAQRVMIPGTVLLVLAALGIVIAVIGSVADIVVWINDPDEPLTPDMFAAKIAGSLVFISSTAVTTQCLYNFRNLRSLVSAWTGLVLAMLPCGTCMFCPIAIPFAIWGMVLLNDPQIKESFRS